MPFGQHRLGRKTIVLPFYTIMVPYQGETDWDECAHCQNVAHSSRATNFKGRKCCYIYMSCTDKRIIIGVTLICRRHPMRIGQRVCFIRSCSFPQILDIIQSYEIPQLVEHHHHKPTMVTRDVTTRSPAGDVEAPTATVSNKRCWKALVFVIVIACSLGREIQLLNSLESPSGDQPSVMYITNATPSNQKTPWSSRYNYSPSTATEGSSEAPPWAIFYNVYTHPNDTDSQQRSKQIFREQMQQIGRSFANLGVGGTAHSNSKTANIPAHLFLNTIGYNETVPASLTHDKNDDNGYCERQFQGLKCHFMNHYETGFEDQTLQQLHHYCHEFPNHLVIYLHNKGSFRPAPYQRGIRRSATDAVTSQTCLESLLPQEEHHQPNNHSSPGASPPLPSSSSSCNVCGDLFMPVWGPIFSANFFAARCDYVQQLIAPKTIEDALEQSYRKYLELEERGHLQSKILPMHGVIRGQGRYSHEDWIAGHPSIRPCDICSAKKSKDNANQPNRSLFATYSSATAIAPCHPGESKNWYGIKQRVRKRVLANEADRMRDYLLLPGHLFKWFDLYGAAPANNSWVWDWFPDGLTWREAVAKFGTDAVQQVTKQYITTNVSATEQPVS